MRISMPCPCLLAGVWQRLRRVCCLLCANNVTSNSCKTSVVWRRTQGWDHSTVWLPSEHHAVLQALQLQYYKALMTHSERLASPEAAARFAAAAVLQVRQSACLRTSSSSSMSAALPR